MRHWLLSRPFQAKFFFGAALTVGAALLVAYLHDLQLLKQFQSRYLQQETQQRTHILAMALMGGTASEKPDELRRILQEAVNGYCYLVVQDTHGRLLASTALQRPEPSTCVDKTMPLVREGTPFGTLHYGINMDSPVEFRTSLAAGLLLVFVLCLVFGTAAYFFFVRRLFTPLQAITHASESMANGNLNVVLPQNLPENELGRLVASFNRMVIALRQRVESQQSHVHALYAEQARLQALLSTLPVGILFVDHEHKVQFINQACRQLWGFSESEEYIGRQDRDLIANASSLMEHPDAFVQHVEGVLKEYGVSLPFDTPLHNGRIIRSRSCVVPDATGECFVGRIWIFEEVSKGHGVHALTKRDALTNLSNRRRFEDDLERMFAHAQRHNRRLTLMCFDLDDFKDINDRFDRAGGDKVLKEVSHAVLLRSRRNEIVYRLGGDEFGILIADAELKEVEALARRLTDAIGKMHFNFAGNEVNISCSMGIATFPFAVHGGTALELVQHADLAMLQAKHSGGNCWHVFNPEQPLDLGKDSR